MEFKDYLIDKLKHNREDAISTYQKDMLRILIETIEEYHKDWLNEILLDMESELE